MEFARNEVAAGRFSINRICQLCGLSKATYYHHRHPNERFETKYASVKASVKRIIKYNGAYGVKRIKAALKTDYHILIGRDALNRLLKLWGLELKRKIRKSRVSLIKKILLALADRTNLLIRTDITEPLRALTSDITEIYYANGRHKAYLAIHKDVFGQMVYGSAIKETMDANIVIDSLSKAKKRIKQLVGKIPKNMICHQDQGSQYTSYEYVDAALKTNLILSYSTPGAPTENPGQESFFGRLKDENQTEFNEITNFKELKRFINKRINYYNKRRIHTSLNCQRPEKFTKDFIKKLSLSEDKKRFSFFRG